MLMKLHKSSLKSNWTTSIKFQMTLLVHITHAGLIDGLGFHFKHGLLANRLAGHTHTHTHRMNFSHLTSC